MLIHIFYIDDFIKFIDSQYDPTCFCNWAVVKEQPDDQEPETVAAWENAKAARAIACAIQCPPLPKDCTLKRKKGDTEQEWRERCAAVNLGIKQGITRTSFAGNDGEENESESEGMESW